MFNILSIFSPQTASADCFTCHVATGAVSIFPVDTVTTFTDQIMGQITNAAPIVITLMAFTFGVTFIIRWFTQHAFKIDADGISPTNNRAGRQFNDDHMGEWNDAYGYPEGASDAAMASAYKHRSRYE